MKKITFFLLLVAFIWSDNTNAQIQIGENIFFGNTDNNFNFGKSVSISSDGSKVVTSYIPINGSGIHEVRVFENINENWIQLGQTIYGDISGDGFGSTVEMSDNGSRIAIYAYSTAEITSSFGHVRIYEFNGSEWVQLGDTISGENSIDKFGSSMSFSSDGSIIAMGAPGIMDESNYSTGGIGGVSIFKFYNNEWQQIGQNIIGGIDNWGYGDKLGESVSISKDGYRLVIGGSGHYLKRGVVRVFNYNEATNIWEQVGSDIVGERGSDFSGSSISISNDGLTVAIGAYGNDENGDTLTGHVRVYKYNNTDWVQVGQDIDGENGSLRLGTAVSLSGDGKYLVSGTSSLRLSSGTIPPLVKIYKYSELDNSWVIFNEIETNIAQGNQSISLSKDASTLMFQNRIGATVVVQVYKVNFNEISGKLSLDFGNNGCVSESIPLDSIKVSATKGSKIISTYTESDGSYSLLTGTGNYNVSMDSENKYEYLDFTKTKEITFDDFGNVETLNICITSNITLENELDVDEVGFPTTRTLSLNQDGSVLAVGVKGYVEVYDYINNEFIKKGETLFGESDYGLFGNSIALSSSGNRIVIGEPKNFGQIVYDYPYTNGYSNGEGGEVKVFDYVNDEWVQVGQDIQGVSEDNLGYSVSISADGSRIGIGVPEYRANGPRSGKVLVYELRNGNWVQLGMEINNGASSNEHFGLNISFSGDGNHIAISEAKNASYNEACKVRVYEFDEVENNWVQMGGDLIGDTVWDFSGANIYLSENGNILSINATTTNGTQNFNYVRVLEFGGNEWIQRGSDFANSGAGILSDDGNRIVVNSKITDNTPNNDYTQVYDYNGLYWEPFGVEIASNNGYANPDVIELSGDGTRLATNYYQSQKIYLYDIGGNAITGVVSYDNENNNCTDFGIPARNLKINTTVGGIKTTSFTNEVGFYKFNIKKDGIYNVQVEDSRFNMSPNFSELQFIGVEGKKAANFCVSANTVENDVSVTLLPVTEARPGFNAEYQIVYENIGTTVSDGNITFQFNNILQSFVGSTKLPDIQTANTLNYNYGNLLPFESRTINVTLKTEPPSTVNADDVLPLSVVIESNETDTNLSDNDFKFDQIVVNSFDPNDKQVLQGSQITTEEVNQYLNYIIRFQNTGSASAINVRVRDLLEDKLDWDTFLPVSASHSYTTQITDGNVVDFYFEHILLPAQQDDEANSHGFIAFKIKPKTDVNVGDIIQGKADIYFDFNSPIITNTVSTEIVDNILNISENKLVDSFKIYPNPAKVILTIKFPINQVKAKVSIYDLLGKEIFKKELNTINNEIDIHSFQNGMYLVKIKTESSTVIKRVVKQ